MVPKKESLALKLRRIFFSPARFLVGFLHEIGRFRIWAALFSLIIVMIIGKLFTDNGLLLVLIILVYILLYYLNRWFEKQENR